MWLNLFLYENRVILLKQLETWMGEEMHIHESGENYLEAILKISEHSSRCRSVDVAKELGFSKPSVSVMIRELREQGFIEIDELNNIRLTESGKTIAKSISERHEILVKSSMF